MMITQGKEIFRKYTDEETFNRIVEYSSISEMWKHSVEEYGDEIAVEYDGVKHTYREIEDDVASFRGLLPEGSKTIGLLASNSYDFVKGLLAITTSGNCAVVLPAFLDEKTVFGCTMKFSMDALVYQDAMEAKTSIVKAKQNVKTISLNEKAEETKGMVDVDPKAGCVVMFTGGTTGQSKGAKLSNEAVMQGVVNGCYGYKDVFRQRYLLVLPLSHVFGLIRNLLTSLYTGSAIYICKNNQDMFKDIAMFRPTILVVVPALAEMALSLSKKFGKNMLGDSMKYIICGAATVSPYLVGEYKKYGIALFPGYGLTETANLVSGNPESDKKPESVGIPYPNQEFRIENGELWLKGKNMMDGYIGEDNSLYYENGWFKTGDLVRFDDEGFLYITGRIKEIIVLPSGENISPAEVEGIFNEFSGIQDCQVFEDLNEKGDHILALEVVPRATEIAKIENPGEYIMSELEKINSSLPSFKRVSRIVIRDTDFERTPSMKIVRYHKC